MVKIGCLVPLSTETAESVTDIFKSAITMVLLVCCPTTTTIKITAAVGLCGQHRSLDDGDKNI